MTSRLHTVQPPRFPDRGDAGRRLAWQLTEYSDAQPVVVGVAPNGVPIAAEIARALGAPLDTVALAPLTFGPASVRRFGVAAEGGTAFFDPDRRTEVEADPETVDAALVGTEARLQQRTTLWRGGRRRPSLNGRTVLLVAETLVDERLAAAGACAMRDRGASHVVYVTPRARLAAVRAAEEWIDEVVGLEMVDCDFSPADCYEDSSPVTDHAVRALLRENQSERRQARRERARG